MKFTDRSLTGLKPKKYAYDVREKDGFVLRVYPSGRKHFQFIYRKDGKETRVSIGQYPNAFTLKQAREKHSELYGRLKRNGTHEDVTGHSPAELSVSKLAERFLKEYSKVNNTERVFKENGRILDKNVLPFIGSMEIEAVKRIDVQQCLKECIDRHALIAHNHTLSVIRKMFNWAIEQGLIENNPAHMIKKQPTQEKSRTLKDDEIKRILSDRDTEQGRVLNLILLTGARPGECQKIKFEDIENRWWSCHQIKGGRISDKKTYLVDSALEIIGSGKGIVFKKAKSINALAKYVQRNHQEENSNTWTPHDIRRTVATRLKQMGFPNEHVSALLGHSFGKLNRTYMVYDYEKEKKAMLLAWEKELKKIEKKKSPSPGGRVSDISET